MFGGVPLSKVDAAVRAYKHAQRVQVQYDDAWNRVMDTARDLTKDEANEYLRRTGGLLGEDPEETK